MSASSRPYYEDDFVTLYHGDCLDVFSSVGWFTGCVLITDPPYGFGTYPTDISPQRNLLQRWLHSHATAALFGYPEILIRWCIEAGRTPDEWVTWWATNASLKTGRASKNSGLLPRETECIAVFGSGVWGRLRRQRFGAMQNYADRPEQMGRAHDARLGDVWTDASPGIGVHSASRKHPNEKPIAVLRRLVEALTEPGDVVLDPYVGSGTTLRAAKDLGRKAIGIEIDERYCEIAAERMAQEVLAASNQDQVQS